MDGAALRRAREAAGLSREALADQLCRSLSTIVRWETGKTSPPPAVQVRLARLLDAPELSAA